jgi:hypothetical protein
MDIAHFSWKSLRRGMGFSGWLRFGLRYDLSTETQNVKNLFRGKRMKRVNEQRLLRAIVFFMARYRSTTVVDASNNSYMLVCL